MSIINGRKLVEYQVVYSLGMNPARVQLWCNYMARGKWTLMHINGDMAVFQRPCKTPRDNKIIYVDMPGQFSTDQWLVKQPHE